MKRRIDPIWRGARTGRRLLRLAPIAGALAVWMLGLAGGPLHANSLCDLVSSNPPYLGGPSTSATSLLNLALDSSLDVSRREPATLGLCQVTKKGDREVTDGLVILTTDTEVAIRAAALQMLAILGTADHREVALRSLYDQSSQVRRMAVFALSQWACEGCLDGVVAALEDSTQPLDVRESAVVELAKHRYEPALSVLRSQLSDAGGTAATESDLPLYSALALAAFRDDSGMGLLASAALASETREGLRVKSILAIESLTGETFGYVNPYYAPTTLDQRQAALSRLADWWSVNGGEVPR